MLRNFQTVSVQICVMLILMLVGMLCRRLRFLDRETVKKLADLMLYIVTPCVIIKSFCRPFDRTLLAGFLTCGGAALAIHGVSILLALLVFRERRGKEGDGKRTKVLRFGTVFSNCGFMSIPLLDAILGEEGVFYGAAYLAVFNILVWTVGVLMVNAGKGKVRLKTILLHPAILSVVVGLALFFSPVSLPEIVYQPVEYLSFLNTPVPMLIIGYYIAEVQWKSVFRRADEWLLYLLRLIVLPLLSLAALVALGVRGNALTASILCAAAPIATISTMFAAKYDGDAVFSARTVSVSTVLSLVTMTGIVGLSMYFV